MWPSSAGSSCREVASLPASPVSRHTRYRASRSSGRYGRTAATAAMITDVAEGPVRLRPFREEDLEVFVRTVTEPEFSLPFEWPGYRSVPRLRARWEEDSFLEKDPHYLAVVE